MAKNISVLLTGGIGDLVLSLGLINKLRSKIGDFDFYCDHPEVYRFFTGKKLAGNVQAAFAAQGHTKILINTFGTIRTSLQTGKIAKIAQHNREFITAHKLEHYIKFHPYKDGIATNIMQAKGFHRSTLAAAMLGFNDVPYVKFKPKPLKLDIGKYITIHDGYGMNHLGRVERATKTWDVSHWNSLVKLLKRRFKKYKIVQLGGQMARKVEGVDYAFINSFSISDSLRVLSSSKLHIDGDSGLVHAAHAFSVPSVVMFGPTPAKYFGYDRHINLQTKACTPCWWSNDLWVKECPRGFKAPVCMNTILPKEVLKAVNQVLK